VGAFESCPAKSPACDEPATMLKTEQHVILWRLFVKTLPDSGTSIAPLNYNTKEARREGVWMKSFKTSGINSGFKKEKEDP